MMQTSLLLMKSLNRTKTPISYSVVVSLFLKVTFFTFIRKTTCTFVNRNMINNCFSLQ